MGLGCLLVAKGTVRLSASSAVHKSGADAGADLYPMAPLTKIRLCLVLVMAGLFVAGVTAFPLLVEVNWISQWLAGSWASLDPALYDGLTRWILTVWEGLEVTYRDYPWLAYGTDWLASGHLMIMLFFILPYREPVRYEGVLWVGVWASLLVFPLAFICGPLRGIP